MGTVPKPGQPGNPGRPKGSKNKRLEFLRSHDKKLQKKVLDMAMEGDVAALKIIADRLWPRIRAQAASVVIDAVGEGIADQGRKIIDAALSGEVTPDVLRDLLMALYAHGRLIEMTELESRLRQLEKLDGKPPWESSPNEEKPVVTEKLPLRGKRRRSKT